ncbi:MAG: LacI family DNA-binding transcriptional regulator [Catenulispora sp.]|nr:LacI family DNA-binding transcriptional regulator [Catenulispora sp.]
MPRPSTLTQVAARAGVSLTTASKAINNTGRIAKETRERVLEAARELRFVPNPGARSLHTGRTSIVGALILDSRAQRFAMPLIVGADTALSEIDLSIIACNAKGDVDRARALVEMLRQRAVDGLMVIGEHQFLSPSLTSLIDRPVIYVHGETADPGDTVYLPDDRGGIRMVVDHLVATGRTRFLHITGPKRSRAVQQRVAGLRAAIKRTDARLLAPIAYGEWSQRWAREPAAHLLRAHPETDAVICGSDQIATGVADAIAATGRRIPDDIALTGFDNWPVFAEEMQPPLTTVDMNIEQLGAHAAEALMHAMNGAVIQPGIHRRPCSLIIRESTATAGG